MSKSKNNVYEVFENIIFRYLGKSKSSKFSDELIANVDDESKISAKAVSQISELQLEDSGFHKLRRFQIESLITQTENKLVKGKFLDLLLNLAHTAISLGDFNLAVELFENVIRKSKDDSNYIDFEANGYLGLGEVFTRQAYWDKSLKNIKLAKKLFLKQKFMTGAAKSENLIGIIHGEKGELLKSKKHFEKALTFLSDKKDKFIIAWIETNLGVVNQTLENYDIAMAYFYRSLATFEILSAYRQIASVRYNIGSLLLRKNEFDAALTELDLSIAACEKSEFVHTLGMIFLKKADIYIALNDLPLAIAFADKALEVATRINDRLSIAEIYRIKGVIHRNLENYELSENYLQTSLRLNKEFENQSNVAETAIDLGKLYENLNQYRKAKIYFQEALNYYKSISVSKEVEKIEKILKKLKSK